MPEDYFGDFQAFMAGGAESGLAAYLPDGANLTALRVYRNGYYRSAIAALRSNYPAVAAALDPPAFDALARRYIHSSPPPDGLLILYGQGLSGFCSAWLADLAALDRAWLESHFSAESGAAVAIPEDPAALEKLRVDWIPSLRLLRCDFQVLQHWQALRAGGATTDDCPQQAQTVMMWRDDTVSRYQALADGEAHFLEKLGSGGSLLEAAQSALDAVPEFDAGAFFGELLQAGLLQVVSTQPGSLQQTEAGESL